MISLRAKAAIGVLVVIGAATFVANAKFRSAPLPVSSISGLCESRPGGSRWAGEYVERASYGNAESEWIERSAGMAYTGDGVVLFDGMSSQVIELDSVLNEVKIWGRKGEGPGEMVGWGASSIEVRIDLSEDGIAVFDMAAIHLFSREGRFKRYLMRPGDDGLHMEATRLRLTDNGVLYDIGGYIQGYRTPGIAPMFTVRHRKPDGVVDLLSVRAAPLPTERDRGMFTYGRGQPLPLWDYANGCVVAASGHEKFIVATNLLGAAPDTLAVDVPEAERVEAKAPDFLGGGRQPAPTAPKTIVNLLVDPDGYAWILPVQQTDNSPSGIEIFRVALKTGAVERDTVQAFPAEFGAPGEYYSLIRESLDVERLVRFTRNSAMAE